MRLDEVENPLLEVVKRANLYFMEEVGLQEVAHDTGVILKNIAFSVIMAGRQFSIRSLCVGIAERSVWVVIPPVVLLVRRDIISKFVL